jgi:hypothetical protein
MSLCITIGTEVQIINRDSGSSDFFQVVHILGQRWWARRILQPESPETLRTIYVRNGQYTI